MIDILSLKAFLLFFPIIITSVLMTLALFAHLNWGWVREKKLKSISAIIGGVIGYLYFVNMYSLNVTYAFYISDLFYLLILPMVIFVAIAGFIRGSLAFGPIQILGLVLFLSGFYLLLA